MTNTQKSVSTKETTAVVQAKSTKKTWVKPEMKNMPIEFIDFKLGIPGPS